MKAKKQFSVLALMLAACLTGSTMVTALADDKVITSDGEMIETTTQENYLSTGNVETTYQEGVEYSLGVYLYANQPVASYQMEIEMPYFVEVTRIQDYVQNDTSAFTEKVDGNRISVAYSSAYDMNGGVTLFDIYFTITEEITATGWLCLNSCMFTNSNYAEVGVSASLGCISVTAEQVVVKQTKGDVNMDGMIDLQDIILTQQYIVGTSYLNDEQYNRADINNDGMVNILDCQYMQGYLVGRLNSLENIGGVEDDKESAWYELHVYDMNGNHFETTKLEVPAGRDVYDCAKAYVSKRYSFNGLKVQENEDGSVSVYLDMGGETDDVYLVELYAQSTDGTMAYIGGFSVGAGTYVYTLIEPYTYKDGYAGCNVDEKSQIYSDMRIVLYYNTVNSGYEVRIEYYCEMNGECLQMSSGWSTYPEGESLLNMVSAGEGFIIEGVYYDADFTKEVTAEDVLTETVTLYVKMTSAPVTGTYEVVDRTWTEDGKEEVTSLGTAVFYEDGMANVIIDGESRTGEFVNFGDEIYVELGTYSQMVLSLYKGEVELEYYFDGSDLPVAEEYEKWAGEYKVVDAEDDSFGSAYDLTLYSNGVFKMTMGIMFAIGRYSFDGDIIGLDIDGDVLYAQYNNDGTFSLSGGSDEGGSGDVEIGGNETTTISGTWKCDSGNEYGIYYVEFFEDRTFNVVAESGKYSGQYYMMSTNYVSMIYSVEEGYEKGMHVSLADTSVLTILDVTDGEKLEKTEEMAAVAGVYTYTEYDETGSVMVNLRYDIRANGVIVRYLYQYGYEMVDMATYTYVDENTIAVESMTIALNRETMTFAPVWEEDEGGSSDVIIDETVNGDYTYTENGDYSYNVVG
ncbi:MAG: hypothetical protein IJZ32_03105 [Clostridia bacterium]|nr:hypothetical protein [Clostridia bacterium]